MAAAAPLPALVNAHDGVQIGGCTAFSKSKARATPGLTPGPVGLGLFHQGLTCTRRGRRDAVGFAVWGPVTKIVDRCQRAVIKQLQGNLSRKDLVPIRGSTGKVPW
jgi:hypothetical protein